MMLEEELFSILKTGARPRSAVFRSDCRVWMAYGNFRRLRWRPEFVPYTVGLDITEAYWLTASI